MINLLAAYTKIRKNAACLVSISISISKGKVKTFFSGADVVSIVRSQQIEKYKTNRADM